MCISPTILPPSICAPRPPDPIHEAKSRKDGIPGVRGVGKVFCLPGSQRACSSLIPSCSAAVRRAHPGRGEGGRWLLSSPRMNLLGVVAREAR